MKAFLNNLKAFVASFSHLNLSLFIGHVKGATIFELYLIKIDKKVQILKKLNNTD